MTSYLVFLLPFFPLSICLRSTEVLSRSPKTCLTELWVKVKALFLKMSRKCQEPAPRALATVSLYQDCHRALIDSLTHRHTHTHRYKG